MTKRLHPARSGTAIFVAMIAVSLIGRLWMIWSGFCERGLLADDAYYYFTIATHIAHGAGPTFDGLVPTNGFHPLWQFIIVPLFWMASDPWTPIRIALTLTVVFDLVSGLVIVDVVGYMSRGRWNQLLAAAIWFLFPVSALIGLRGMEASLSTMLVLLLLWFTLRAIERGCSWRTGIVCGVLVGMAGLARTDNFACMAVAAVATVLLGGAVGTPPRRTIVWILGGTGNSVFEHGRLGLRLRHIGILCSTTRPRTGILGERLD